MQLNRQTEIAIDLLVACAQAEGRIVTTKMIAETCRATSQHAAQVVSKLTRLGWLESRRGKGGGLTPGAGMETLTLGHVVEAFGTQSSRLPTADALRCLMQEAENATFDYLNQFTIGDLMQQSRAVSNQAQGRF